MDDSVLHIDPFPNLPLHAFNFIIIIVFFFARLRYSNKKKQFLPILQVPGKWLCEF